MDKGQIVDEMLRKVGYSYSKLASEMAISRTTLYRKLSEENLSDEFIWKVSELTRIDFTKLISGLGPNPFIQPETAEKTADEKKDYKIPEPAPVIFEPHLSPLTLNDCKAELVAVQRELIAAQKYALSLLQQLHSQSRANG